MTESANDSRSSLQELLARAHALLPMGLRTVVGVVPLYRRGYGRYGTDICAL